MNKSMQTINAELTVDSELKKALDMVEYVDKTIQVILGGRMDAVEADLNRHLIREENARTIRERAENAVLRRFQHDGPDPEEVIETVREMSQLQWAEVKKYFMTKDDASLGELIRRLTEDQAIEAEIEASDL